MAGRSKKSQGNFEKIKREMTAKKKKAQTQRNGEIAKADTKNNDLYTETVTKDIDIEKTEDVDIEKSDSITEKGPEEDIAAKKQQAGKVNTVETRKIGLVVFRVHEEEFALRISNIKEIIRVPSIIKVPNAPQYIIGLCSLRGNLLPVIDCRKMFGMPEQEFSESSRIIVADIHGKQVGLASDKVLEVINVEETAVKVPPASIKGIDGGIINGILVLNDGKRVVMILDAEKIIKAGNIEEAVNQQHTSIENITDSAAKKDEEEQIVIFNVGVGEYALSISYVKEIIRMPDVMKVPNTASYIEGVFSVRNQLLTVINLGKLLGINCKHPDKYSRVIIINNGNFSFGVIVDKVSHVVRVQKELFKESGQNDNFNVKEHVKGIFNLDNGQRLVMMLEPDKLISLEDVKGVLEADHNKLVNNKSLYAAEADNSFEFVVFKMGEEEYGIEINNVQEVNRIREITHFPGAPAFIAGMVDLRGDIVPVLNLRRLFDIDDSESYKVSKLLVAEFGKKRIGILIDSVSGVLKFSKDNLEKAPEALRGKGQDCYIDKVAKLNDGKRIILILNLPTLLSFM